MSTLVYVIKEREISQYRSHLRTFYIGVGNVERVYESAKRIKIQSNQNSVVIGINSRWETKEEAANREKELIIEHSGFDLMNDKYNSYFKDIRKIRKNLFYDFINQEYDITPLSYSDGHFDENDDLEAEYGDILEMAAVPKMDMIINDLLMAKKEKETFIELSNYLNFAVSDSHERIIVSRYIDPVERLPTEHVELIIEIMKSQAGMSWRDAKLTFEHPSYKFNYPTFSEPGIYSEMEYIARLVLNAIHYYGEAILVDDTLGLDQIRWSIPPKNHPD